NIEGEQRKLEAQIETTQAKLTALVGQGNVKMEERAVVNQPGQEDERTSSFAKVTETQYGAAAARLFDQDMQLIEAQTSIETAKAQLARAQELTTADGERRSQLQVEQLEDRIREEFQKDPELMPLIDQIQEARETLQRNKDRARRGDEPAVVHANKLVK